MGHFRLSVLSLFILSACVKGDPIEMADMEAVQRQQAQYGIAQPLPSFDWSLERDVAIQLYQARNERVSTWTVWRGDTSQIEGLCPSVGYPIPYDTSLTNPEKLALAPFGTTANRMYAEGVLEQAEPNGLYASKNSIATWVRCIFEVNGNTIESPVYVEGKVTTYPVAIIVDIASNTVSFVSGQQPTVVINPKQP